LVRRAFVRSAVRISAIILLLGLPRASRTTIGLRVLRAAAVLRTGTVLQRATGVLADENGLRAGSSVQAP
jgi:hypothetical protein